ncbi:MAG: hypothetical protein LBC77_02830 [Spirochaetaceae bacterium]|jgi:hypothetical protein|nr:hypothetical protein [Spirochaetaceae bacterium]
MKAKKLWFCFGFTAVLALLLMACPAEGAEDSETVNTRPKVPVFEPNELKTLSLKYDDSGGQELITFSPKTLAYSVNTVSGHERLVLSYEKAYENAEAAVGPTALDKLSGQDEEPQISSIPVGTNNEFPVPIQDRDFYLAPAIPEGVEDYVITVTVTPEGGGDAKVYQISVGAPPPVIDDDQILGIVQTKIAEAEEKIADIQIAIGDPGKNTGAASLLSTVISELDELKKGTTGTREMETDGETITEEYQVYNWPAIVAKTRQLTSLIDGFEGNDAYIIVSALTFAYKPEAQKAVLAHNAKYELELKGASGGHIWTNSSKTAPGGRGSHITANFNFNADTELAVITGGEGTGTASYDSAAENYQLLGESNARGTEKQGGFNGGGKGGAARVDKQDYSSGASGGGATDVRLWANKESGLTFNTADPRIVVAAGGGGAAQASGSGNAAIPGGNGGGPGKSYTNQSELADTYSPQAGDSDTEKGQNGLSAPAGGIYEGRGGGGGGFNGGGTVTDAGTNYKSHPTLKGGDIISSGAGGTNHVRSDSVGQPVTGVHNQWGNGMATIRWISNN